MVPLACPKNAPDHPSQGRKSSENDQKIARITPESAREIGSRVRGYAATARWSARDLAARQVAQVKVRSELYAKNVKTTKSSKLALAEELALGDFEPVCPLSEATLIEGLSLGMMSLFLHEGMSGPRDVMHRLPTSKKDSRGNRASRRLTCQVSCQLKWATFCPKLAPFVQFTVRFLVCTRCSAGRSTMTKVQLVQYGAWPLRRVRSLRGTAMRG